MIQKTIQLACGKPMVLKMVSLQKLAATDVDLPNQARNSISDLVVYGAMITGKVDDKKRGEENWALVRSQLQLAKLLAHSPKVWLSTDGGECPPDAIPDEDLFPVDLVKIQDFFFNGGSDGVPVTPDSGIDIGAPTDSQGAAMGKTAE